MYELHLACAAGDVEKVKAIAQQKLALKDYNINEENDDNLTPIEIALNHRHIDIAAYLLKIDPSFPPFSPLCGRLFDLLTSLCTPEKLEELGNKQEPQSLRKGLHDCFHYLGKAFESELEYESAAECFDNAYQVISSHIQSIDYPDIIDNLIAHGKALQCHNFLTEAATKFTLALGYCDSLSANKARMKTKVLEYLIEVFARSGNDEEALNSCSRLIELLLAHPDLRKETHLQYFRSHAVAIFETNPEESLEYFQLIIDFVSASRKKSDNMQYFLADSCLNVGIVLSQKLCPREDIGYHFQQAINAIYNMKKISPNDIKMICKIYNQWLQLYFQTEPGFDALNCMMSIFNSHYNNTTQTANFLKLYRYITDHNNWQLAQPLYEPYKQFLMLLKKIIPTNANINPSIRAFLSKEENLGKLDQIIAELTEKNVMSLQSTIYSGTAPLFAFARHQQKMQAELDALKQETQGEKRKADKPADESDRNEKRPRLGKKD